MTAFQKLYTVIGIILLYLVAIPLYAQDEQTIRIATGDAPPWTGKTLHHGGFVNHLISEAFKKEGYSVKFEYYPWKRSYEQSKQGKFHATSYWYKSKEREKNFYYSTPVSTERIVFFCLKSNPMDDWETFDDLRKYRIGATKGYLYAKDFWDAANSKRLKVDLIVTDKQNFTKLLGQRIDIFLCGLVAGKNLLLRELGEVNASFITHHSKPLSETTGHPINFTQGGSMRSRTLGKTGMNVTELCMGCWEIGGLFWGPCDAFEGQRLLNAAYDTGVSTYDLADVYGNGRSEAIAGRTFGNRRDKVVLITKAGYLPGADGAQRLYQTQVQCHDPKYLKQACEMSLWRLETDYIDVYLLHDPPMEVVKRKSVWNALQGLVEQGKIRAYGVSAPADIGVEAIKNGAQVVETPFNLLTPRPLVELLPLAQEKGVGILARSPFASGRMFQKGKGAPAQPYRFLARKKRSLTAAAIKYVLAHEAVSAAVTGIIKKSELNKNVAACKRPLVSKTDLKKIAALHG